MADFVQDIASDIDRKAALFLIAGTIFGLTAGFLAAQSSQVSKQQASQELVSTLEAQSGQQLEVVNVRSENGLYRIDISDSQNQLNTYYVTKNGRMASESMSNLQQLRQTIDIQKRFVGCLSDRDATLYGNSSQQETLIQIQALGGENIVSPIYKDVRNQEILQEATQRGVRRVPSIYYNESVLSGVKEINQISQFAGCQLDTTQ